MLQGDENQVVVVALQRSGPGRDGRRERVSRRAVRLICAGWLPQDGLFGWDATAGV
jgi:hypothetical protein